MDVIIESGFTINAVYSNRLKKFTSWFTISNMAYSTRVLCWLMTKPVHTLPPTFSSLITHTARVQTNWFFLAGFLCSILYLLAGFHEDNVKQTVNMFYIKSGSFYNEEIYWVPQYNKCTNNGGNYIKKKFEVPISNNNKNGELCTFFNGSLELSS